MGSELERFIKDNPSVFDAETPADGHMERFMARLDKAGNHKQGAKKRFPVKRFASITALAASVVLMLVLFNAKEKQEPDNAQFLEAAAYFSYQLKNTAEEVRLLTGYIDPAYRKELLEDIERLSELPIEGIPDTNDDDRIGMLYEHFEARVSSLRMIESSISQFTETE